ncbi:MAG: CHAT domain-containing protein [Cyanothece sp. SIO2G6]|nr:CHAT domain-containing protein [Cyanothece sp. SIO2G6]
MSTVVLPVSAQPVTAANDNVGTVVTQDGQSFDITGGTSSGNGENLFHSFEQFGLSQDQIATFMADPHVRNILSRVVGGDASIIDGLLTVAGADANLYLMNPAGVFFGENARLDVPASFTATTATGIGLEGNWFNTVGENNYSILGGTPDQFAFNLSHPGAIFNAGNLAVEEGQTLALIGGSVTSVGQLAGDRAQILLAAVPGESLVTLRPSGHILGLTIDPLTTQPTISDRSQWTLPVADLPSLLTGGDLDHANQVTVTADGTTVLSSGLPIGLEAGDVNVAGNIHVSSTQADQMGGTVSIVGNEIGLLAADINANGPAGGGTVRVGGNRRGLGLFPVSDRTYLSSNSQITADATANGDGGEVILYSGNTTGFFGTISAQGGPLAGNGGFIEVSGRQNLVYRGTVNVETTNGIPGTFLLDPENIEILPGIRPADEPGPDTTGDELILLENDFAGATTTLYQSDLEAIAGTILLEATNDITIAPLGTPLVFQPGGDSITFRADTDNNGQGDFSMSPNDTLFTNGRNLTISGTNITLGNVNTLLLGNVIAENPDELTNALSALLPPEGESPLLQDANTFANVVRGDIHLIASENITTDNLETHIPQSFVNALNNVREGTISISSNDTGIVAVESTNGSVSIASVNTSSPGSNDVGASDVAIAAAQDVEVGTIDASAIDGVEGPFAFGSDGGNVVITGERVRLTGVNENGDSITTAGETSPIFSEPTEPVEPIEPGPIEPVMPPGEFENQSGTVTITHRGGPDNVPFVIGEASENGTAGSINTGVSIGSTVTTGSFDVITGDTGVIAAGSDRVTITSINSAPVLTSPPTVTTQTDTPVPLSLNGLTVTDDDTDNTVLVVTSIRDGAVITLDGEPVVVGDRIALNEDGLVYMPANGETGVVDVLTFVADDNVSTSNPILVTATITAPATTTPTLSPTTIPTPTPTTAPTPTLTPNPTPTPIPDSAAPTDSTAPTVTDVGDPPNDVISDGINDGTSDDANNSGNSATGDGSTSSPQTGVLSPGVPANIRQAIANDIDASEPTPSTPPTEFITVSFATSIEENTYYSSLERSFTDAFVSYLNLPEDTAAEQPTLVGPDSASSVAQEIEQATGERPGFIYVNFVPKELMQGLELASYEPQNTDELELVVITADGGMVRRRVLGVTRGQVTSMAQRMRRDITAPTRNATRHLAEAQQLYQWLVAPIHDQLEQHEITNLSFLAADGLRSLPFAALHDGNAYLAEQYSVGLMPSLQLTNTKYVDVRNASMLAMGVSESVDGQTPLPAVPAELSTLIFDVWNGELFLNETATIETLREVRRRNPYGIVHMATHARFQPGPYDNSYIQMWNDQLNMEEIRDLGLNSPMVEMLVLSACQTALGNREAELGFAGLAVQAGVKTAIASLWSVDDAATMSLMSKFYSSLSTAPIKSEALRQAQVALLQGNVRMEDDTLYIPGLSQGVQLPAGSSDITTAELAHPYYWSAFTIVGNPW